MTSDGYEEGYVWHTSLKYYSKERYLDDSAKSNSKANCNNYFRLVALSVGSLKK
jgi:hypothetical protein